MEKSRNPLQSDDATPSAVPSSAGDVGAATTNFFIAQIEQQQLSGPVPSPELLRQYESLRPGFADRLIRLAEQEAEHRRKMESEVLALQSTDQKAYRRSEFAGQIFGLCIGLAAIAGAVVMAVHGAQLAATFLGTGGVTGLVTAFILGRSFFLKQKKQEFEQMLRANEAPSDPPKSAR